MPQILMANLSLDYGIIEDRMKAPSQQRRSFLYYYEGQIVYLIFYRVAAGVRYHVLQLLELLRSEVAPGTGF